MEVLFTSAFVCLFDIYQLAGFTQKRLNWLPLSNKSFKPHNPHLLTLLLMLN